MGTKGGKPLSTLEKRQKKIAKEEKKSAKEEKKETKATFIDESLVLKAGEELENSGFATAFALTQKLNIKYSIAKRIIKELVNRNEASILTKSRRVIIVTARK
ncbi:MAG: hypothetical protein QXJ56_02880 [Ignisphaera sp.]|uniref:30S ribosomal protein S25e n=1 Tax=Ignisphaera aggregans TaxID=334771 RepID=A0A7J3I939_9CREN